MKRITSLLLVLAMWSPSWAQGAKVPAGTNSTTVNAVSAAAQANQGNPDVKVWVNTASGVYHCPGTRWYGSTKRGE